MSYAFYRREANLKIRLYVLQDSQTRPIFGFEPVNFGLDQKVDPQIISLLCQSP